jgi:hypothetical protein
MRSSTLSWISICDGPLATQLEAIVQHAANGSAMDQHVNARLAGVRTALDHFGRPGRPSAGLGDTVCDRLPPEVPKRLGVENRVRFEQE